MKTHARVVVIGGRSGRCHHPHHLVKKWLVRRGSDKRSELTVGSTWHAAGLLPLFNMSCPDNAKLRA